MREEDASTFAKKIEFMLVYLYQISNAKIRMFKCGEVIKQRVSYNNKLSCACLKNVDLYTVFFFGCKQHHPKYINQKEMK